MDYLQDKVNRYCKERLDRGVETTLYDISKEFEGDWWNIAAVLYGTWLRENSEGFTGVELSQQEW